MSVSTTRPQFILAYRQITGVQHVFDHIPRTIQTAEMPGVIVFPGEMDFTKEANDLGSDDRIYRCWLILAEAKLGIEGQTEIDADPWFSRVRDHFVARPGLELDNATLPQDVVFNSEFLGDGGFSIRPYGSKDYAVIEFRHRVNEYVAIAYQD